MKDQVKEFDLDKSYQIDVIVPIDSHRFAGEIDMSPEEISFRIRGEHRPVSRNYSFPFKRHESHRCFNGEIDFHLIGLTPRKEVLRVVESGPDPISYFENICHVDAVVLCPGRRGENPMYNAISIRSDTISEWIGHTTTQQQILASRFSRGDQVGEVDDSGTELEIQLGSDAVLWVSYERRSSMSAAEFHSTFEFPPSLSIAFRTARSASSSIQMYRDLCNLLELITGKRLLVQRVRFHDEEHRTSIPPTLYYPTGQPKTNRWEAIFIPLGRKLAEPNGLPPVPDIVFQRFFGEGLEIRENIEAFIRYRRRENIEERFLGMYRLLELFCVKSGVHLDEKTFAEWIDDTKKRFAKYFPTRDAMKSFLGMLKRFNESKYTTEKRFSDFIQSMPEPAKKTLWLGREDLRRICDARNDLVHGRRIQIAADELRKITAFIDLLVAYAILDRLGFDFASTAQFVSRDWRYRMYLQDE